MKTWARWADELLCGQHHSSGNLTGFSYLAGDQAWHAFVSDGVAMVDLNGVLDASGAAGP